MDDSTNQKTGPDPVSHKAPFSDSPLANPKTPIYRLAVAFQDHLFLPDPFPLYALMGSLVANYIESRSPLWLVMVGPPSCGKSELLNSLLLVPGVVESGSINSLGSLLSGSRRRDRERDATGGILRQIGDRGAMVLKEFGSIITTGHERQREILGALREIYDGRWTRHTGADGGRPEHWEGRAALLAGATEAIWSQHQVMAELGERFLYYDFDAADGWAECYEASRDERPGFMGELQRLVLAFAGEVGLDRSRPLTCLGLEIPDRKRITALAQITAASRGPVYRDPYTREVLWRPQPERPARLGIALASLLRALRYIGLGERDGWRLIRKIAFDSIPFLRRSILLALLHRPMSWSQLLEAIPTSHSTLTRSLEDLRLHGVIERQLQTQFWGVSPWTRERVVESRAPVFPLN